MIDPVAVLRAALLSDGAVAGLITTNAVPRIYSPDLPEGYDAKVTGSAITFFSRGGTTHPESNVLRTSFQITAWGFDSVAVRALYGAIWDFLQGKTMLQISNVGFVMSALEQVQGQDITEPETGWSTVVSFWELALRSN